MTCLVETAIKHEGLKVDDWVLVETPRVGRSWRLVVRIDVDSTCVSVAWSSRWFYWISDWCSM